MLCVRGEVAVPRGRTLRIFPRVVVLMEAGASLKVEGTLEVLGTAEAPVLFTGRRGASWGEVHLLADAAHTLQEDLVGSQATGLDTGPKPALGTRKANAMTASSVSSS